MAEYLFTTETPNTPGFDGTWHTFTQNVILSQDGTLKGGRAWFPNSTPANFLWVVYKVSDQTLAAQVNLTALPSPTNNAWNEFTSSAFGTPGDVALPAGQYRCGIATNGDFIYHNSPTYPVNHGGILTSDTSAFHNGGSGAVYPETTSMSFWFFGDMLVASGAAPVTVNLTPAVYSLGAQPVMPVPGMVTVALTPAQLAVAARPVTATPGMVTVALTPAQLHLAAQPFFAETAVEPGLGTPGGSVRVPGPSGRVQVPTPSGRP